MLRTVFAISPESIPERSFASARPFPRRLAWLFATLLVLGPLLAAPAARASSTVDYDRKANGQDLNDFGYANPLDGFVGLTLEQPFYSRHYVRSLQHTGVDFMTPAGQPVYSICPGKVTEAKVFEDNRAIGRSNYSSYYNSRLVVQCTSGPALAEAFLVIYAHVKERSVNVGDTVAMGQQIAAIAPAYTSGGALRPGNDHLHFGLNVQNAITYVSGSWGFGTGPSWATLQNVKDKGFRDAFDYLSTHLYNMPWLESATTTFPKGASDTPTVLTDVRPTLTWKAVKDASAYQVVLIEVGGEGFERFVEVTTTSYRPDVVLKPGSTYKWKVVAKRKSVKPRTKVENGVTVTEGASEVQYFRVSGDLLTQVNAYNDIADVYVEKSVQKLDSLSYKEVEGSVVSLFQALGQRQGSGGKDANDPAGQARGATAFNPAAAVTRAELVALCLRAANVPLLGAAAITAAGGPRFSDTPASHPLYRYVETARSAGDVAGYDDGTFGPDLPVSRSEAAKIAANIFNLTDADINVPAGKIIESFSDFPKETTNPDWQAMRRLVNIRDIDGERVWSGFSGGLFHPSDRDIDRAQAAKLLAKLVSLRQGDVFSGDTAGESFEQDFGGDATPPAMLTINGGTSVDMTDSQRLTITDPNVAAGKTYFWTVSGGTFDQAAAPYNSVRWTPPKVTAEQDFHLTVHIANGQGYNAVGDFTLTVTPSPAPTTDAQFVDDTTESLTEDLVRGSNGSLGAVTGRLRLPGVGPYATSIAWQSDAPTVVAADGAVTRPAHGQGDRVVTLTATVTKGQASRTKAFTATVIAREAPPAQPVTASWTFDGAITVVDGSFTSNYVQHPLTLASDGILTVTTSSGGGLGSSARISVTKVGAQGSSALWSFSTMDKKAVLPKGNYVIEVSSMSVAEYGAYTLSVSHEAPPAGMGEVEPNDTRDTAQALPPGGLTGALGYDVNPYGYTYDLDFFSVMIDKRGSLFELDDEYTAGLAEAKASWCQGDGCTQGVGLATITPFVQSNLAPGRYFVLLSRDYLNQRGVYRIRGIVTEPAPWVNEAEPNERGRCAKVVGSSIVGEANSQGEDCFSYTVPADGTLTVEKAVSGLIGGATLSVKDANFNNLASMDLSQPGDLSVPKLSPGTYCVVVSSTSWGNAGQYSLRPVFTAAGEAVTETESNDTQATADLVEDGRFSGTIGYPSDMADTYAVDLTEHGELTATVDLGFSGSGYYWYLWIQDANGWTIAGGSNKNSATAALGPGRYFVQLMAYSGPYGPYTGTVAFTPADADNPTEIEPNGDFATANAMQGGRAAGHIGYKTGGGYQDFDNADCHAFTVAAPGGMTRFDWTVSSTFNTGQYEVLSESGSSMQSGYFYSGKSFSVPLTAGNYAVCAKTYSADYYGTYAVRVIQGFADTDNDGLDDNWERTHFGSLAQTGSGDADGDGLTNLQEYSFGGDPKSRDTDGDGLDDRYEYDHDLALGRADASADDDGDGYTNLEEYKSGSNPGDWYSRPPENEISTALPALNLLLK